MTAEVDLLRRAHALFAGASAAPVLDATLWAGSEGPRGSGVLADSYRAARSEQDTWLRGALDIDARVARLLTDSRRDHGAAQHGTGAILAAALDDVTTAPNNPIAAREARRRTANRLRAQHAHVRTARARAERRRAALRRLRYRTGPEAFNDGRRGTAVRAALSRLGRPYVWGATGPDRFDCSGLVQWAYAQAGVRLPRTTYEQIHEGLPIARSQVRPGDLVFPHTGHVQMAIGNGMVVEAPQPGANVKVSRMGSAIAIRRPS